MPAPSPSSASPTSRQLREWRIILLNGVLRAAVAVGFFVLLGGFYNLADIYQREVGHTPDILARVIAMGLIYSAIFGGLIVITLVRALSYEARVTAFLALLFGLGALSMGVVGINGGGRIYLFTAVVLSAILLDVRHSLTTLSLCIVAVATLGALEVSGAIVIPPERQIDADSPASWVSGGLTFIGLSTAVLISAHYLLQKLVNTLADAHAALAREQRLSRVLHTLSDINQLIVRERHRGQLLHDACRILVREREYAFAWIGLLTDDGTTAHLAAASEAVSVEAFTFRIDDKAHGPHCVAAALRTRAAMRIEPNNSDACAACPMRTWYPQRSAMALPLISHDHLFGALEVVHALPDGHFDDEEIKLLQELADDLAFALESLALDEAHHTQAHFTAVLNDITHAALTAPTLGLMVQTLADQMGVLFQADACHITLWDDAQTLALPGAAYGPVREAFQRMQPFPGERTLTETVLRVGHTLVAEDMAHFEYAAQVQAALDSVKRAMPEAGTLALHVASGLAVPLLVGEQKLGAVLVIFAQPRRFSPQDIARAEQAAGQVALAVAKARLLDETQVKAAELSRLNATLEEREAYFRALVENSAEGVAILDAQGNFRYVAPAEERLSGYAITHLLGESAFRFMHPDDLPRLYQLFEQGVQTPGTVITTEYRLRRKDGEWRHFEVTGQNLLQDPHIAGVVLNYRDITERVQAIAELREREQHSLSLLRLSRALERSQTYTDVLNAALEEVKRIVGYQSLWVYLFTEDMKRAKAFIQGGESSDLVVPELTIDGDALLEEIRAATAIVVVEDARTDPRTDKVIVERIGLRTVVNVPIILFDRHLGAVGAGTFGEEGVRLPTASQQEFLSALASHMAMTLDRIRLLTERARTEAQLRQLSRAVEQSPVSVMITDTLGNLVYVNPQFTLLTGYAAEEVRGRNPRFLKSGETPPEEYQRLWTAITAGGQWQGELHNRKKNGDLYWESARVSPVVDEAGQITHYLAVKEDITARKEAEEALRERERHSQALLHLSRNLERAQTYSDILNSALKEVQQVIGYQSLWVYLYTEDGQYAKALLAGGNAADQIMSEDGIATLTIKGDRLLEEIVTAKGIVIVEDARTDARTDKAIVKRMNNRTIVNVPVILFDKLMGAIGVGTFGDEGVRVPSRTEQEFLMALASHLAVALDRIQLLAKRTRTEAQLRQRASELEALVATSLALRTAANVTALLPVVVMQALKVVNGGCGSIFLCEPDTNDLVSQGWYAADEHARPLPPLAITLRHSPGEGITGHVARTGQPHIIDDLPRDPLARILPAEAEYLRSLHSGIALPLRAHEQVIGVLHLWLRVQRAFSDAEIRLLTALAEMASAAIHRATLYEQAQRHADELAAALTREQQLNEVARTVSSTLDNETILRHVMRLAVDLTAADAGTIGLMASGDSPQLMCRHYYFPTVPQAEFVAQADEVGRRIITTGRSLRLSNYSADPQALPALVAVGAHAFLGVPLSAGAERLGVLGLFMLTAHRVFTERDHALAETVGQEAGVALQNSRLYENLQTRNAELEQAVRRARALAVAAEEANRLKSEFLANTSHELRTPLTAIIGSLDLVLTNLVDSPQEQHEFVRMAQRSAFNLREIVEQLLDAMRLEAQKMDVRLQVCDVALLVEEVRWKVQPAALAKNLALTLHTPPHLPRAWADPDKVRQILLTLAENAIKFTQLGGVTIRVEAPTETATQLTVQISDTGVGIPLEQQAKLFQPFVQADGSNTRHYGGLGLSLSISRRLAELMGGALTLFSAGPEQGTTITLTLPLAGAN